MACKGSWRKISFLFCRQLIIFPVTYLSTWMHNCLKTVVLFIFQGKQHFGELMQEIWRETNQHGCRLRHVLFLDNKQYGVVVLDSITLGTKTAPFPMWTGVSLFSSLPPPQRVGNHLHYNITNWVSPAREKARLRLGSFYTSYRKT